MSAPTHVYLGLKPCGCFGFAGGDEPELAAANAEEFKWLAKIGGNVNRMTLEEYRAKIEEIPASCDQCKNNPPA